MKSSRLASCFWVGGFTLFALAALWQWPRADAQIKAAPVKADDLLRFEVQAVADPFLEKPSGAVKVRRGQVISIVITGTPSDGYHTYPVTKRTSSQSTAFLAKLQLVNAPGVTPLWPIAETEPEKHRDDTLGTFFEHYKTFNWVQDVLITADAPIGMFEVPVKLDTQVCKGSCYPVNREWRVSIEVTKEDPLPMTPDLTARLAAKKPTIEVVKIPGEKEAPAEREVGGPDKAVGAPKNATGAQESSIIEEGLINDSHEDYKAKIGTIGDQIDVIKMPDGAGFAELIQFMLTGMFWGAISLITPCVFPMIPITVSFFLKKSEQEHNRPIVLASVYSLTIVIVLTLAAAFLLWFFRLLSVHPITNFIVGGLFIYFALSLFGMYEIELPHFLARYTSAHEGKGGLAGTIFMALTFTIISFACVAPFLGGFSGTAAAARPWWHNLLGGLAFSATFASPFFVLALFPALLRKMPKSGSWLNVVKVVMGFLELAAAFKFFRTAELVSTSGTPSLFTFDLVLGLWIALCVLCGLYLIGIFRLPHDTPEEHITVPRLLLSGVFLGLAIYLTPALFKVNSASQPQRPGGAVYAWIDSFLLPESRGGDGEIIHTANLDYAVRAAREERRKTGLPKRIFIDFTGISCVNCNKNEQNVFAKPAIVRLFQPYIVVKMYTDTVPGHYYAPKVQGKLTTDRLRADAKQVNLPFQVRIFSDEKLPLYAILEPDGDDHIRVIGVYPEGLINNESKFADFLRDPDKK